MEIKETIQNVTENLGDNKGAILTVVAVLGTLATAVLTVRATLKAKESIDEHGGIINKEVATDIVKAVAPAAAMLTVTIISEVAAHKADVAKYAALAAVVADSKKVEQITKKVTGKDIKAKAEECNATISKSKERWYDAYSGLWFETDLQTLLDAISDVKNVYAEMPFKGYVSVDNFYNRITDNIPASMQNSEWDAEDGIVDLEFDAALDENLIPYRIFRFSIDPKHRDID